MGANSKENLGLYFLTMSKTYKASRKICEVQTGEEMDPTCINGACNHTQTVAQTTQHGHQIDVA